MTELSSAADAVLDAAINTPEDSPYEYDIAAALRAAADLVVPEDYDPPTKKDDLFRGIAVGKTLRNQDVRAALYRIAAELEGQ